MDPRRGPRLQAPGARAAPRRVPEGRELGALRLVEGGYVQPRRDPPGLGGAGAVALRPRVRSAAAATHPGARVGAPALARLLRAAPRGAVRERRRPGRGDGPGHAQGPRAERPPEPPPRRTLSPAWTRSDALRARASPAQPNLGARPPRVVGGGVGEERRRSPRRQ